MVSEAWRITLCDSQWSVTHIRILHIDLYTHILVSRDNQIYPILIYIYNTISKPFAIYMKLSNILYIKTRTEYQGKRGSARSAPGLARAMCDPTRWPNACTWRGFNFSRPRLEGFSVFPLQDMSRWLSWKNPKI